MLTVISTFKMKERKHAVNINQSLNAFVVNMTILTTTIIIYKQIQGGNNMNTIEILRLLYREKKVDTYGCEMNKTLEVLITDGIGVTELIIDKR